MPSHGALSTQRHFRIDGLSYAYPADPTRRVLRDVHLTVSPGERIGLIGENGAGKSTLVRLVAGELEPLGGDLVRPASLGVLLQEHEEPEGTTLGDVVEHAIAPVRALVTRLESSAAALAEHPDDEAVATAYDDALAAVERDDPWSVDARVATVLASLGLGDVPLDRPLASLSGGTRRRVHLAVTLLGRPDALLLDEPTNHLDDAAVDFLVAELTAWPGSVLVASHDRWFLDEAMTGLVDLDRALDPHGAGGDRQGTASSGGFSAYLVERERARRRWAERYAAQEEERAEIEAAIGVRESDIFHRSTSKSEGRITAKFYADRAAKTQGGRVHAARARLAALEREQIDPPPVPLRFGPLDAGAASSDEVVVRAEGVGVDGRLSPLDLTLGAGEHLLVTGPNGAGKSTLLALLGDRLAPDTGTLELVHGVTVRRLEQHDAWSDLTRSAGDEFDLATRGATPGPATTGLLEPRDLGRPVGELSPGQRRRLAIAITLAEPPDVLLLDEPTNHLALALVDDLERALAGWPGTLVIASHDRWLRRRWAGRRLHLAPARRPGSIGRRLPPNTEVSSTSSEPATTTIV
ncbi:ABC-F family ATP-binding cassette domain-containing protein [Pseudoclavibacter chungangensis]|uniref:ABC-F family ATP-binding cassette domain-containing protein n=1 Tax=Pseudoclavibacter chungangensis TaxID=587635 RepID=A0A7J5BPQ9_9MICO|nr:ABC-F family ATP-binding cassette domain-containing protein [Pseudoclavibacter chungangensis]KAB1655336.1 ABC-F family ATP-binding cassette domain-containing protein [Pseudoclavibacter chungangensis]NYJ68283.1 macrolide transport system ATP-binding/permease protein [Pseudoclavibacter chungangensis]